MWSPRQLAKTVHFHARRMQMQALALPRGVPWARRALHLPRNTTVDPLAADARARMRVIPLDPPGTFRRPLPQLLGPDAAAQEFFTSHSTEQTAATYVAELDGGLAWGHPTGGVFTADGRLVPAFTHDPCGPAFHPVWQRARLPRPQRLPGRTLYLVTPEATDNFHHWLIDLLPRIGLVRRAGYEIAAFDHVVVNHANRRYQLETLSRLGVPRERVLQAHPGLWVQSEQLVVPSLKPSNQCLPAADLAFLREALLGPVPSGARRRRLFLSRADASYRRLRNEVQWHDWLRQHDFEILRPAELSVVEQARRFAEAEIVAGPAGAAFANLVFASAPAHVLEIAPPQWLAAFHWMISARLGLPHTIVLGEGPVMTGVPDAAARHLDIVLEPAKFHAAFAAALAPVAA